ncbi:MAG TPA: hypothetical protein VGI31_09630 [Streptosporangiaceae bacterium]
MVLAESGGGGDYVAINPQLLQSMINSMNSSAGEVLTMVNGYISRFSEFGIDTSSLSKAVQDLTWAQDQVPMLNRRQSLAQAMEQQDPALGPMVSGGAGTLDFATNSAAQAAGKSDGAKALQALEDHSNNDFILSELKQYSDDPAYLAAFFQSLSPQGLTALGLQVTGYQQGGDKQQYQDWASTVGTAFATASYQMPFSNNWLSNLQLPNNIADDPAIPQLDLIQPFLEHGVYSASWLNPLGQYALQQDYMQTRDPGMMGPGPSLDGIWTALSNNPAVDAQFYQKNFNNKANPDDSLSGLMSTMYGVGNICDSAFAGMVKSATIPPDAITPPGAYASNAQMTIQFFGNDSSARTSAPVRAVFGSIAENYFNSLANSVRAAAPYVGTNGVNMPGWLVTASQSQWGNFVEEAMRDKTTSAQLLTFYSAWVGNLPPDDRGKGQEQVPRNQGFWNDSSVGLLDDFMAHNYQAAGAPAGDSSGGIAEVVAAAGSSFLTGLVFGPEGGLLNLAVDAGKDAFQTASENAIKGVWPSDPKPSESSDALSQLTGVQQSWASTVNLWYGGPPGHPLPPPSIDTVHYLGQTYTGDPTYYEKKFNGYFINKDGQVDDPATIAQNPAALAAYNAWLQDPAIVNANEAKFGDTQLGKLMSQYANSYGG